MNCYGLIENESIPGESIVRWINCRINRFLACKTGGYYEPEIPTMRYEDRINRKIRNKNQDDVYDMSILNKISFPVNFGS